MLPKSIKFGQQMLQKSKNNTTRINKTNDQRHKSSSVRCKLRSQTTASVYFAQRNPPFRKCSKSKWSPGQFAREQYCCCLFVFFFVFFVFVFAQNTIRTKFTLTEWVNQNVQSEKYVTKCQRDEPSNLCAKDASSCVFVEIFLCDERKSKPFCTRS